MAADKESGRKTLREEGDEGSREETYKRMEDEKRRDETRREENRGQDRTGQDR